MSISSSAKAPIMHTNRTANGSGQSILEVHSRTSSFIPRAAVSFAVGAVIVWVAIQFSDEKVSGSRGVWIMLFPQPLRMLLLIALGASLIALAAAWARLGFSRVVGVLSESKAQALTLLGWREVLWADVQAVEEDKNAVRLRQRPAARSDFIKDQSSIPIWTDPLSDRSRIEIAAFIAALRPDLPVVRTSKR